eukprot:SAG11_NODE_930_length_6500_cov_4.853304_10_plen_157_part_00
MKKWPVVVLLRAKLLGNGNFFVVRKALLCHKIWHELDCDIIPPRCRRGACIRLLVGHVCALTEPPGKVNRGSQGNPSPFAGLEEASAQHLEGIGVHDGRAPDMVRRQHLARMAKLGVQYRAPFRVERYHTEAALADARQRGRGRYLFQPSLCQEPL